jgi:hypothetical protein
MTVRTSETSVDNYFTRHYNPEDSSEHHTRRRENLKSHRFVDVSNFTDSISSTRAVTKTRVIRNGEKLNLPQHNVITNDGRKLKHRALHATEDILNGGWLA